MAASASVGAFVRLAWALVRLITILPAVSTEWNGPISPEMLLSLLISRSLLSSSLLRGKKVESWVARVGNARRITRDGKNEVGIKASSLCHVFLFMHALFLPSHVLIKLNFNKTEFIFHPTIETNSNIKTKRLPWKCTCIVALTRAQSRKGACRAVDVIGLMWLGFG